MDKLTDITKDYLADFEVLTEARKQFEQELEHWWTGIFTLTVEPELRKAYEGNPDVWENQSRPGMCHWRVHKNDPVYLEIVDPRASDRRFYTVTLKVWSQPDLKKIAKQDKLVALMSSVAKKVVGSAPLNWKSRNLATVDIEIQPEDPDETARQVCDVAVRYYEIVLAYALAAK